YHVRTVAQQHVPTVEHLEIEWHDALQEQRWGFHKCPDYTTNVVTDILPHILSQLTVLFGPRDVQQTEATLTQAGEAASLTLLYGSVPVRVSLPRARAHH